MTPIQQEIEKVSKIPLFLEDLVKEDPINYLFHDEPKKIIKVPVFNITRDNSLRSSTVPDLKQLYEDFVDTEEADL